MVVPQDQIIANVNQVYAMLRSLAGLRSTIDELVNTYTQSNGAAVLGAMPTCTTNADGSLGAADATPVTGNDIDTRIVSTLSIANSAYDIGIMVDLLKAFQELLAGAAVPQQNYAPAALARASTS